MLVTGGAGFIGSYFVKRLLARDDITGVTVLDTLTYTGHALAAEAHIDRFPCRYGSVPGH
ncbi:NAD-dependent epimerase/dehydratase family protein [Streptomyces sp. SD11]|uniref:NAD-dependent epimerase/dehydratase family protein n=1 Tax=Streptomyces sp. SD11 TaxID=3452209 RepID=UPI003F8974F9